MHEANRKIYEFDNFRLDVFERQLLKGKKPVSIPPKAFDLLVALVENNGSLTERESLYARVWPDSIVEDANLTVHISAIRKALEAPSCISTVSGHGYRFNWPVRETKNGNGRASLQTNPIRPERFVSGANRFDLPEVSEESPVYLPELPAKHVASNRRSLIAGQLRKHEKLVVGALGAAAILMTASMFVYFRHVYQPVGVLTDKDVVLIADFDNNTGDEIFDGTLKRGLSTHLQQSPFLSLFPDAPARETLKMMNRPPDERITREVAREICQRRGLKALIAGTIDQLGNTYVLTLEAINAQTNEVIVIQQAKAEGKDQILRALSQAANQMRGHLGESLASIDQFDVPINTTTSSLDALRVASIATIELELGNEDEAISLFKRATEIDPNFASAYTAMAYAHINRGEDELGIQAASRAFDLRHNVNEWEKFLVHDVYYSNVTQEVDKAIEQIQIMKTRYPRDSLAPSILALRYISVGEFEKAVAEANDALLKNPHFLPPYRNLVAGLVSLNRFDEAKVVAERAIQLDLGDPGPFRRNLVHIALVQRDQKTAEEQLDLMKGRADGLRIMSWEIGTRMYRGQWKAGTAYQKFANGLSEKSGSAGGYPAPTLLSASFGRCDYVTQVAPKVLATRPHHREVLLSSTALAFCGDSRSVLPAIDQMATKYPKTSIVHQRDLPMIRAALELGLGNPEAAIELLWPVRRSHESTTLFWIQYIRGQAYLKLKRGQEAAVEFRKILDHRGEAAGSPLFPLAHLGLARALTQTNEIEEATTRYQQFFDIWKDADADLPVAVGARREYDDLRLKHRSLSAKRL